MGEQARATITNNFISNNQQNGVELDGNSLAAISNNLITLNSTYGILMHINSKATIINNTVVSNGRHGIDCEADSECTIINNISYKNAVPGIGARSKNNIKQLRNNLSFGNTGGNFNDFYTNQELTSWGNLQVDPKFFSTTDFYLQTGSPAINAGDPNIKDPGGTRSDIGMYGGPNACLAGDCSPGFKPILLNSSFEWGTFDAWNQIQLDQSFVADSQSPGSGPSSDGRYYAKLTRLADLPAGSDPHLASDWIETGQNVTGKHFELSFDIKAHNTNATIKGIMIQREPKGNDWGQGAIVIPDVHASSSWQTFSYQKTMPGPGDGTRFRIVLRPETSLPYVLPIYYDNVRVKLVDAIPPTNTPFSVNETPTPAALTLNTTVQANGNVVLTWNNIGAARYEVLMCTTTNCTPNTQVNGDTHTGISFTHTAPWTTAFRRYRVEALPQMNASVPSSVSSIVRVEAPTTVTPPISPPISMQPGFTFNAALQANGEVKLDWTFIDTASKNVVQSCSSSASNSDVNNCTFTQLADTGLTPSYTDTRAWGTTKFKYYKVIVYGQSPSDGNLGVLHTSEIKTIAAPIPPSITQPPTYMLGDFDQSGSVSLAELRRVMMLYGQTGSNIPEDVNADSEVNLFDVTLVMANFLR